MPIEVDYDVDSEGNMTAARQACGLWCSTWRNRERWYHKWHTFTSTLITGMVCCAFCGSVSFGNTARFSKTAQHMPLPPYALSNFFMLPHMTAGPNNEAWVCGPCTSSMKSDGIKAAAKVAHLVFYNTHYIQRILSLQPEAAQLLSLVDLSLDIKHRFNGYASGELTPRSLLDGPILRWGPNGGINMKQLPPALYELLACNLLHNPMFKKYKCMLEYPHPTIGVPFLSSTLIERVVQNAQQRGPTVMTQDNLLVPVLTSCMLHLPQQRQPTDEYEIGYVMPRSASDEAALQPLQVDADGIPTDFSNLKVGLTFETAAFSFLFPHGIGFFRLMMKSLCDYLHMRMSALFSIFTLYKPYVLLMYQLRQATQLAASCSDATLSKWMVALRKKSPDATQEELLAQIIKFKLPKNIPGTPSWHRSKLNDLLALVDRYGLPSFFLTLTADECTSMKWEEINDLEAFLKRFNASYSWQDAPVECAKLFVTKVQKFMEMFISGARCYHILGKVIHYVIRYEMQGRGSLHAHILLWVETEDVQRITNDICAAVPALFDEVAGEFIRPDDPLQARLFDLVLKKQQHVCRKEGCQKNQNGPKCQYGFAFDAHPDHKASYNLEHNRWEYYRPCCPSNATATPSRNRNIIPYHAMVLLLWGAHMNLQRITNDAWSFYVLKYAMKCEPAGKLFIDRDNAAMLGLGHLSDLQLMVIGALHMHRNVTVAEAALGCLEVGMVQSNHAVTVIDSGYPDSRLQRISSKGIAPIDRYCGRRNPGDLSDITFTQYFKEYELSDNPNLPNRVKCDEPDAFGSWIYKRKRLAVVRFTDYHPGHHTEGFFYNVLLDRVPFYAEHTLLSEGNDSYFIECRLRGILTSEEELDDLIQTYSEKHLHRAEQIQLIANTIKSNRKYQFDPIFTEANNDTTTIPSIPPTPANAALDYLTDDHIRFTQFNAFPTARTKPLNPEQTVVFNHIMSQPGGLFFVSGVPGAGKSHLIQHLANAYADSGRLWSISATTGIAAIRLSPLATTMHAAYSLPTTTYMRALYPGDHTFQMLITNDLFIIDEISMALAKNALMAVARFESVHNKPLAEILKTKKLVLVGDPAQLPPVCNHHPHASHICTTCHVYNSPLAGIATHFFLQSSVRHMRDSEYGQFLNIIRHNRPTQADIDRIFTPDMYISDTDAYLTANPHTTILCTHREEVAHYNALMLNLHHPTGQVPLNIKSNAWNVPAIQEWLYDADFWDTKHIAIGAHVILTSNVDLTIGAANGARATVTAIEMPSRQPQSQLQPTLIKSITVKLDVGGAEIKLRMSEYASKHSSATGKPMAYYKLKFPIVLAHAMTAHKCQGATIAGNTLVHVRDAFVPGLLYVMLSRVTERRFIRVVQPRLTPDHFNPLPRFHIVPPQNYQ